MPYCNAKTSFTERGCGPATGKSPDNHGGRMSTANSIISPCLCCISHLWPPAKQRGAFFVDSPAVPTLTAFQPSGIEKCTRHDRHGHGEFVGIDQGRVPVQPAPPTRPAGSARLLASALGCCSAINHNYAGYSQQYVVTSGSIFEAQHSTARRAVVPRREALENRTRRRRELPENAAR